MQLENGHAGDGAVVLDADEQMDVVGEAGNKHLDSRAVLAAVHADDARIGAGVLLGLVLTAAGQHVAHYCVKLRLGAGLSRTGEGRIGPEQNDGAGQDDGDGYKQLLHVHFPAPPFMTPKRLTGMALSSAHAKAFIRSMA